MAESLSASLEDYLEAIFHIIAKKRAARPKDVSDRLHVNNSSVTGALNLLAKKGLVNYAPYDLITLTAKGEKAAEQVVQRHMILRNFFEKVLSVSPAEAENAACGMEHAVVPKVFRRLVQFAHFVEKGSPDANWLVAFRQYCEEEDTCREGEE